jgi:ketosteroid isomerase-like protein
MSNETDALAAETSFFTALLAGDAEKLQHLLTDDFMLIDVMSGSEISKEALVGLVGAKQLVFHKIDHIEAKARLYGDTAVITGRTLMGVSMGEMAGEVKSRYTHVFVKQDGAWHFASAQGTQIAE